MCESKSDYMMRYLLAKMEVAVVAVVCNNGTNSVIVSRENHARSARLLAILNVVRVAICKHRQLEHPRRAITAARHGETFIVLELVRVTAAVVIRRRILCLFRGDFIIDVTTRVCTAVHNLCTARKWRGRGKAGRGERKDKSQFHFDGRVKSRFRPAVLSLCLQGLDPVVSTVTCARAHVLAFLNRPGELQLADRH